MSRAATPSGVRDAPRRSCSSTSGSGTDTAKETSGAARDNGGRVGCEVAVHVVEAAREVLRRERGWSGVAARVAAVRSLTGHLRCAAAGQLEPDGDMSTSATGGSDSQNVAREDAKKRVLAKFDEGVDGEGCQEAVSRIVRGCLRDPAAAVRAATVQQVLAAGLHGGSVVSGFGMSVREVVALAVGDGDDEVRALAVRWAVQLAPRVSGVAAEVTAIVDALLPLLRDSGAATVQAAAVGAVCVFGGRELDATDASRRLVLARRRLPELQRVAETGCLEARLELAVVAPTFAAPVQDLTESVFDVLLVDSDASVRARGVDGLRRLLSRCVANGDQVGAGRVCAGGHALVACVHDSDPHVRHVARQLLADAVCRHSSALQSYLSALLKAISLFRTDEAKCRRTAVMLVTNNPATFDMLKRTGDLSHTALLPDRLVVSGSGNPAAGSAATAASMITKPAPSSRKVAPLGPQVPKQHVEQMRRLVHKGRYSDALRLSHVLLDSDKDADTVLSPAPAVFSRWIELGRCMLVLLDRLHRDMLFGRGLINAVHVAWQALGHASWLLAVQPAAYNVDAEAVNAVRRCAAAAQLVVLAVSCQSVAKSVLDCRCPGKPAKRSRFEREPATSSPGVCRCRQKIDAVHHILRCCRDAFTSPAKGAAELHNELKRLEDLVVKLDSGKDSSVSPKTIAVEMEVAAVPAAFAACAWSWDGPFLAVVPPISTVQTFEVALADNASVPLDAIGRGLINVVVRSSMAAVSGMPVTLLADIAGDMLSFPAAELAPRSNGGHRLAALCEAEVTLPAAPAGSCFAARLSVAMPAGRSIDGLASALCVASYAARPLGTAAGSLTAQGMLLLSDALDVTIGSTTA